MKLNEYLETVSEQIRYTKIRSTVTEELKNHILDQAADYEACGAFPEEALERAVREMGDPVETGVALDRIHRPQMNWSILIAIAVLSILGVGVYYIANIQFSDTFPWQRQAMYVLLGLQHFGEIQMEGCCFLFPFYGYLQYVFRRSEIWSHPLDCLWADIIFHYGGNVFICSALWRGPLFLPW